MWNQSMVTYTWKLFLYNLSNVWDQFIFNLYGNFFCIIYKTCDIEDEIDETHVNLEIDFVALGVIKPWIEKVKWYCIIL